MSKRAATAPAAMMLAGPASRRGPLHRLARIVRSDPVTMASVAFIAIVFVAALLAGIIAPYEAREIEAGAALQGISANHWFGTDEIGRDIFSRVLFGARVSLNVGGSSALIGIVAGGALGIVSGYVGGKLDLALQRMMDAVLAFPALIFAMTIVSITGPGQSGAIIAISIIVIPTANRVARSETLSVRESEYIRAAQALGASPLRIMVRHVLPNVLAPLVIIASIVLGAAILVEASLSFLGLGVQPPDPSWGQMLSGASRAYLTQHPILAIAPGLAISLTVLAFNLIGDAVRDALDPRLRI